MKKLLVTFLFVLAFANVSYAKNVKFIQVSNVLYNSDNAQYLKEFVEDVNTDFSNVDFVVFTGDNLAKPDSGALWNFLNTVKKIKPRTYIITGDRDLFNGKSMSKANYMHLVKKRLGLYHSSKSYYTFKKGNIVFVAMDGAKEYFPSYSGYYQHDVLAWLDKTLTKNRNKKVVILQHFPLIDSDVDAVNLYKKEDYLDVLNKHDNILAVISGHYSENKEENINNVQHIITQKFSNNSYYKIIEIDENDYFIYTSLINNKH